MSTLPKARLTPEQYLETERAAETRSEYFNGEMLAMPGATEPHVLIVMNVGMSLRAKLRPGPCRVYASDMRVRVSATGLYTYPDVAVVCAGRQFLDARRDTLLNPMLIVEVLSRSTEDYDRGRRFGHYRSIESLQEYVLISSQRVQADVYRRQSGAQWLLTPFERMEDTIRLESVGCEIPMAEIYEAVELDTDDRLD